MRTWGRTFGVIASSAKAPILSSSGVPILPSGNSPGAQFPTGEPLATWTEVQTDAAGNNDLVYLTTLCQCLLLEPNESPFFANYGISGIQAIQQQVAPDVNVARMQRAFAPYFAALQIVRTSSSPPTYRVSVRTHQGVVLDAGVPIPY